jgi:hypothetical protein
VVAVSLERYVANLGPLFDRLAALS